MAVGLGRLARLKSVPYVSKAVQIIPLNQTHGGCRTQKVWPSLTMHVLGAAMESEQSADRKRIMMPDRAISLI